MNLWAKSRGLGPYIVACAITGLMAAFAQHLEFFAPNLTTGQVNHFPASYALAAIPILFWIVLVERSLFPYDDVSLRVSSINLLDLFANLLPLFVCSAALYLSGAPLLEGVARNLLFFNSLGIFALAFTRRYFASSIPVFYLLGSAMAGFGYVQDEPRGWAFVLGEWAPSRDLSILALALAISTVSYLVRRRERSTRYNKWTAGVQITHFLGPWLGRRDRA